MPIVTMPDGTEIEFPDSMSSQEIEGVLAKQYGKGTSSQPPSQLPYPPFMSLKETANYSPPPEPPQTWGQIGRGMLENLPATGFVGGSLLGGPAAGMAGAMGGSLAKDLAKKYLGIEGAPSSDYQLAGNAFKEGAMAGMAELASPYIGKVIQRINSPFAESTAARMAAEPGAKVAEEMVAEGAPISPSTYSGAPKAAGFLERIVDALWPASSVMKKSRQSLQPFADKLKAEFAESQGLYDTNKQLVNRAWEDWAQTAGGAEAKYTMPETQAYIDEVMKKPFAKSGAFWQKQIATAQQEMAETGGLSVQTIRDLANGLGGGSGVEKTAKRKIGELITKELGETGAGEQFMKARQLGLEDKTMGPIRQVFSRSITEPTQVGEPAMFNPETWVKIYNERRPLWAGWAEEGKLGWSKKDIEVLDNFRDKMMALTPDLNKLYKKGIPSLNLGNLGDMAQMVSSNPAIALAGLYKFPILSVPMGMDYGMAKSLMNQNGLLRKWLTTGFGPPTLSSRAITMKSLEEMNKNAENVD